MCRSRKEVPKIDIGNFFTYNPNDKISNFPHKIKLNIFYSILFIIQFLLIILTSYYIIFLK